MQFVPQLEDLRCLYWVKSAAVQVPRNLLPVLWQAFTRRAEAIHRRARDAGPNSKLATAESRYLTHLPKDRPELLAGRGSGRSRR